MRLHCGLKKKYINASIAIRKMIPYTEEHLSQKGKLWDIGRHLIQLVEGVAGAKKWRQNFSLKAQKANANIKVLEEAVQILEDLGQ